MSKFHDFITAAEHGIQAVTDSAVGTVFDTIDAAAKKLPAGPLQADVLKMSADARANLLKLVDGIESDAAETIADAGDEVLILLASRAELLSSVDEIEQLGAVVIAQAQAFVAQKRVGIDPTKSVKSS